MSQLILSLCPAKLTRISLRRYINQNVYRFVFIFIALLWYLSRAKELQFVVPIDNVDGERVLISARGT